MDTVSFIEKCKRMYKNTNPSECRGGPTFLDPGNSGVTFDVKDQIFMFEELSTEYLHKTRQDVFLEQYPEAAIDNGILELCPRMVSAAHRNQYGDCGTMCESCIDCRCEFWLHEVE